MTGECREACAKGEMGAIYLLLNKLQLRNNCNNSSRVSLFNEDDFLKHLEKITHERHENDASNIKNIRSRLKTNQDKVGRNRQNTRPDAEKR